MIANLKNTKVGVNIQIDCAEYKYYKKSNIRPSLGLGVPARSIVVLLAVLVIATILLPGRDIDQLFEERTDELLRNFFDREG